MSGSVFPGIFFMNLFPPDLPITASGPALLLVLISAVVSAGYAIFWLPRPESRIRSIAKIAPMVLLILAAMLAPLPVLVIAALGACTVGDWYLSMEGEKAFHTGLGAFLAGHLLYIVYFAGFVDPAMMLTRDAALLALILAGLVAMVLLRLWPFLMEMKVPVAVYALIMAIMAFSARLAAPGTLVLAGIALFMLSDILLAQDKFTPLTNTPARRALPWLVWIFYSAGQTLIVLGIMATV